METEIEQEIERRAIVEETHVIQKEVPIRQVVRQPVRVKRVQQEPERVVERPRRQKAVREVVRQRDYEDVVVRSPVKTN